MAEYDPRRVQLKNIGSVCSFVNKIINEIRCGEIEEKKAKTLLYAGQIMMGALERRDHERDIEKLKEIATKLENKGWERGK